MKRADAFSAAVGFVLAAAAVAYCAAWLFGAVHDRVKSEEVRFVSISECVSAAGIIIRDEVTLSGGSAPEGLRVGKGDALGSAVSPDTGIFFSSCDGYESLCPAALEAIDAAGLTALLDSAPDAPAEGRIVRGKDWYFAALTDSAAAFTVGDSLSADFGLGETACTVHSVGEGFVVLSMQSRLAEHGTLRHAEADITLSTQSGLRVPADAVHKSEDGEFVWVITAGVLEKKTIEISFTGDGFCLAVLSPEADALREGDRVVTFGGELYEGKIIT